jgi:hypothetical protein
VLEGVRCHLRPPPPPSGDPGSVWPTALQGPQSFAVCAGNVALCGDLYADEHYHARASFAFGPSPSRHGARRTIRLWVRSPRLCWVTPLAVLYGGRQA